MEVDGVNGRLQKWDVIVNMLRDLGLARNGFSGQITLHFLDGRPTRYELREVRQLSSSSIDILEPGPLDCR